MNDFRWIRHGSRSAMAHAVAERVLDIVGEALARQPEAFVAFPGGRSPIPILDHLAAAKPDWKRVSVVPTDERLVATSHALSNLGMIQQKLGTTGAKMVPLVTGNTIDCRAAGLGAAARLFSQRWPLDLAWLGVGTDGHTASIFPGPSMAEAFKSPVTRHALGVLPDPLPAEAPVARVTLSGPALASARRVLLTISGTEKRSVLESAINLGSKGESPIAQLLSRVSGPVEIHWGLP